MDCVLTIDLIAVMLLNFFENILITKTRNREQRIHATQIYRLYEEIKRYNDSQLVKTEVADGKSED